jgi:hypothetical protein
MRQAKVCIDRSPAGEFTRFMSRRLIILSGGILAVTLIRIFAVAYLLDEPLPRRVEREMNAHSKG